MSDSFSWREVLGTLAESHHLDPGRAKAAISSVLAGEATDAQLGGFLISLRTKGATSTELVAMVEAMLAAAEPLDLGELTDAAVDIVGTGGSKLRQDRAFNISTTSCFVVAGAGIPVCKHGNRKASSSSGSTDVLEALGVAVDLDGPALARCVRETGIGFAFARTFHPAMRHAGPVRAELGVPTVFNILGPLSHPGHVTRQVVGVADPDLATLVIETLRQRGASRAMVVHGSDGLDELTLTGPSTIHELRDGEIEVYDIHPSRLGLPVVIVDDLGVGAPEANAEVVREILAGGGGARRDVVLLNAAAGLVVGGVVDELTAGIAVAAESIDTGAAGRTLDALLSFS